jgi:signal transduction histidine kinase/HPt (histidine-containing phosphotransfer) domain-containing protein
LFSSFDQRFRPVPTTLPEPVGLVAPGEAIVPRALAVAIGLAMAGVAAPITAMLLPAPRALFGPPFAANVLLVALVLIPAGVGLATAWSGLGRILRSFAIAGGGEPEQAVLRIFVDTLLFAYAAALATASRGHPATLSLAIAACGLAAAWVLLLFVILWPRPSALRRHCATVFDIALLSAFLYAGEGGAAGWYALYLLAIVYAGFRFGVGALLGTTGLSLVGFGAVASLTAFWSEQPGLTAGLALVLAALAALLAGPIRGMAALRDAAATADPAKARFVTVLATALRQPLGRLLTAISPADAMPGNGSALTAMTEPQRRILLAEVADLLDLAAIEAGALTPRTEPFDLHAAINETVAAARVTAAYKSLALDLRIDAQLPYQLCGWRQGVERILRNLLGHAIEASDKGVVKVEVAALDIGQRELSLRIAVDGGVGSGSRSELLLDPFAAATEDVAGSGFAAPSAAAFGLALSERIAGMMGGGVTAGATGDRRLRLAAVVMLGIAEAAETNLDLGHRPVLIAADDEEFAGLLAKSASRYKTEPQWIGSNDRALAAIAACDAPERPVLIIDGRRKLLAALTFVHRVASVGGERPFILLAVESSQVGGLAELDDGELDGIVPAPLSGRTLGNALHALPRQFRSAIPAAASDSRAQLSAVPIPPRMVEPRAPAGGSGIGGHRIHAAIAARRRRTIDAARADAHRVTPIAAHPKFAADLVPSIDPRVIEALRELGGDDAFLREVIETFRSDASQIKRRLAQAVTAVDAAAFGQALHGLRQSAADVGGTQLCQLSASLHHMTTAELRAQGSAHMRRLDAEIDRLSAGLLAYLHSPEAQRG